MQDISEDNKFIAKTLVTALGGKPSVRKFWDDAHVSSVDLLTCSDAPREGVSSYATVNLPDHPLMKEGAEYPLRAEIIGACSAHVERFANVIATCAFFVINDKWFAGPSVVFPNVFDIYRISRSMQHIAFFPPFLWEDKLPTLKFSTKTVDWLLAVPISDAEYRFALRESFDALENEFEKRQIDIFDIDRPSVK